MMMMMMMMMMVMVMVANMMDQAWLQVSFNPRTNPSREILLFPHFTGKETEAHIEISHMTSDHRMSRTPLVRQVWSSSLF